MGAKKLDPEMGLWKIWNSTKAPSDLSKLYNAIDPIIQSKVNIFKQAPVPDAAVELEAKKWAKKAFETYDPSRDTKLTTHVNTWLKKVNRYVYSRQNVGHIPEARILQIQTFKNVKENLSSNLNREPSSSELADELNWSIGEISRMESELRKDIAPSTEISGFGPVTTSAGKELLNYIYYELTPEEQVVYDYTVGAHGKNRLSGGGIAKKMNVSDSKVSQIKKKIGNKMREWK